MTNSTIYQTLAKTLAEVFFPLAEVSLFNEENKQLVVFNAFSCEDLPKDLTNSIEVIMINNHQKKAKLTYIELTEGYYLRILADLSVFETIELMIKQFKGAMQESAKDVEASWHDTAEKLLTHYLQENNKSFSALTTNDKRELVLQMHEIGLFRYHEATSYIANQLSISRASVYNYLNQGNKVKSLEIHQVDSFTDEPFSGNPAGVVLDADNLNVKIMQKIARQIKLYETAFVLTSKKADFKLRYFSPNGCEIKFCGHSTVAALFMLAYKKRFDIDKPGRYEFKIETKIGCFAAAVDYQSEEKMSIEYCPKKVTVKPSSIKHEQLTKALGIPNQSLDSSVSIMYEPVNQSLFITATSLEKLQKISVNINAAEQLSKKYKIVAIVMISTDTIEASSDLHIRCFAPAIGVNEDPFTGSILAGLISYVRTTHLTNAQKKNYKIEQGHSVGRPGSVIVKLESSKASPFLTVIATARHFCSTNINL